MDYFGFDIDPGRLPQHVGIIMDGNGRWAKKRGLPRAAGHERGFAALRKLMEFNRELGIKVITVYAFSTENWSRPEAEVGFLMNLLSKAISEYSDELLENNVRIRLLGTFEKVSPGLKREIEGALDKTAACDGHDFVVAFNYGGRKELTDAFKKMLEDARNGELGPGPLTEEAISKYLYLPDLPDPDLIIRTSGELRLSNFLLWESAYSELYFSETLWPDFSPQDFCKAVYDYQQRKRRFGSV